jgi:nucleotide-binding universal stress UspA family protein
MDFTPTGELALEEGIRRATQVPGTVLHVVHAIDSMEAAFGDGATMIERQDDLLRRMPDEIWEHVGAIGARVGTSLPETTVHVHVRLGAPAKVLHQVAVDYDCDLIVVGTHGRKGLDKLVLGSVATALVRDARCPVLVMRPKDYGDLEQSPRPDEARPGEDLGESRSSRPLPHYHSAQVYAWSTRDVHIVGPER